MTSTEHNNLGTRFCRRKLKKGGVSIFVHESINFTGVDSQHRCKEQNIEICAVKINLINRNFVILAVYRAPTGDFDYVLKELEIILDQLYNIKNDLVICGDLNVNYLEDSKNRQQLDNLLATFNLRAIVKFPTRIMKGTVSAIDNIMIDKAPNYI
jgi:exonuclease III